MKPNPLSESSDPVDRDLPRLVETEVRELIFRRLQLGGLLTLPFVTVYTAADLIVAPSALYVLLALKMIAVFTCVVAIFARSIPFLRARPVELGVGCILALGATEMLSAFAEADAATLPIMITSLGLTAAVYLPWGRRTQTIVASILFSMALVGLIFVGGFAALATGGIIGSVFGMLIGLGNSPVIASTIRSFILRNAELAAAKVRLTAILDKRLEDANLQLEKRGVALEQALEEAEKANLSKSRFLANVSHEFRTPLTSILGFAEMLRNGAAGLVSAKQLDYTSEICTSAHHLLRIVEGILTHARIEANEDPIQFSDVPADLLVEVACRQVSPVALEKQISIRRSRPSGAHLLADKQKLLQVLLNLLTNAIKFSPAKGEIGAEVRDLDQGVEIVVWDRGIGLSPSDRERIFLPFEQVDRANRSSQKGTGLGLAIAKRYVEAHGGTIRVDSTPGSGSRFCVALPKMPTASDTWPHRETSLH